MHRQLAKISRSTRGVVLLLCDLNAAKRVMSEAQRLKMTGGHFIWIWADTSSTAEFFQPNGVQSGDDAKDLTKTNYNYEEFVQRKSLDQREPSSQQKYFQQQQNGSKRTQAKGANGNSNRFHHIIGLRKPGDEINFDGTVAADQSFLRKEKLAAGRLNAGQPSAKQKRMSNQFSDSTIDPRSAESEFSYESAPPGSLNIKNINSHEFNANYYDPYSRAQPDDDDFDESTNAETGNYDYDKANPFRHEVEATSASTTARHSEKSKANSRKSPGNRNGGSDNNADGMAAPLPQLFDVDDSDDLSLDSYSDASNDLKAKRADNFPSAFNISSHVFFHHFKDFPVGLLALRHIKMNVDRVFVRSAIRLFASAWSRAETDDDPRVATSGGVGSSWKDNWSADSDYDYDEVNNNNRNKKLRNKTNLNGRQRGSRKYKRDAPEASAESISTLVNSSNKTSNSNSNPKTNLTNSQHVSGLHSHPSDDGNKSNNDTLNHAKTNSKLTKSAFDREAARDPSVGGAINVQKRQNTYWSSNTLRSRSQEKAKGAPQYKGGCFGVPTRADIKRSEVFAR